MSEVVAYVFHAFNIVAYGFNTFQHFYLVPPSTTSTRFARTGLLFIAAGLFSSIIEIIFNAERSSVNSARALWFLVYLGYAWRSIAVLLHVYAGVNVLEGKLRRGKSLSWLRRRKKKDEEAEPAAEASTDPDGTVLAEGTTTEEQPEGQAPATDGDASSDHSQSAHNPPRVEATPAEITIRLPVRSFSFIQLFFLILEISIAILGIILWWVDSGDFRACVQAFTVVLIFHIGTLMFRMITTTASMHSPARFSSLSRPNVDKEEAAGVALTLTRVAEGFDRHSRPLRLAVPFMLLALIMVTEAARLPGRGTAVLVFGLLGAWYEISQLAVALTVIVLVFAVKRPEKKTEAST